MTVQNQVHNRLPDKDPTTGLLLRYGNGCSKGGSNCFECQLRDCTFNTSNEYYRRKITHTQLRLGI